MCAWTCERSNASDREQNTPLVNLPQALRVDWCLSGVVALFKVPVERQLLWPGDR